MAIQTSAPVLKAMLWLGETGFRAAGYRVETRQVGDYKIGLLRRKQRRSSTPKGQKPRRFVFVPGFGDTPISWTWVLLLMRNTLSREFDEMVLLDFPGYGGFLSSEKCFHSMDELVKRTEEVLEELQPDVLVGHSLGGWLSAGFAASCGKRSLARGNPPGEYRGPEKLILVNPAGVARSIETQREFEHRFRTILSEGGKSFIPYLFVKEPVWIRFAIPYLDMFLSKPEIREFVETVAEEHSVAEDLKDVLSDVWLLWGDQDALIPSACVSAWLERLSHEQRRAITAAKGVFLTDVGHSPQLEKPVLTAKLLSRIIRGRLNPGAGSRAWRVVEK